MSLLRGCVFVFLLVCSFVAFAQEEDISVAVTTKSPEQVATSSAATQNTTGSISGENDETQNEQTSTIEQFQAVRISTVERPPFTIKGESGFSGFSIDIWNEIVMRLGIEHEFIEQESFSKMLDSVRNKETDLALANITINAERERDMDFSLPIYNSGYQMVVPLQSDLFRVWEPLTDWQVWEVIVILFIIWLVALHVLWLIGHRRNVLFRNKYPAGLKDTFLWLTIEELRKDVPHSTGFQLTALFLRSFSIISLFLVTAVFASYLTIDHLRKEIYVYDDLFGKKVGVVEGTTHQAFLEQEDISTYTFADITLLKQAIENAELDAVVMDAPVAQYYAKTDGRGLVEVVPTIFKPELLGILFTEGNPLRDLANEQLLNMQEDGTYQQIYDTWF